LSEYLRELDDIGRRSTAARGLRVRVCEPKKTEGGSTGQDLRGVLEERDGQNREGAAGASTESWVSEDMPRALQEMSGRADKNGYSIPHNKRRRRLSNSD
jgi:hypothetical protein